MTGHRVERTTSVVLVQIRSITVCEKYSRTQDFTLNRVCRSASSPLPPAPTPALAHPPSQLPPRSLLTRRLRCRTCYRLVLNRKPSLYRIVCTSPGRGHIFRALIESVCMGTELVFEAMRKAGYEPSSVAVAGGATRSRLWLQVCTRDRRRRSDPSHVVSGSCDCFLLCAADVCRRRLFAKPGAEMMAASAASC